MTSFIVSYVVYVPTVDVFNCFIAQHGETALHTTMYYKEDNFEMSLKL